MVCRRTIWLLCLVFVACGVAAAQRKPERLTPTTAALQLSSELNKESYDYEWAVDYIVSSYLSHGDYVCEKGNIQLGKTAQSKLTQLVKRYRENN
ncbi:MAG: hypothetical protein ACRD9S_07615 [Pyrinomonadaceae bacterium]